MARQPTATGPSAEGWKIADARELYGIDAWGRDFVSVSPQGHLEVGPGSGDPRRVDLEALVLEVAERGIGLPLLIRFGDLLRARIDALHKAFHQAIETCGYAGAYRAVYPIKVNQDRRLIEDLLRFGRPYHDGLEAGSKPELLAVLAMLDDPEALIVCNGYKDQAYIETALLGAQLGTEVVLVAEKPGELRSIAQVAERLGVRPRIGVRTRLHTRGAGHWEASGGDRSKFGLGARDLVEAVDFLRARGLLDCLVLLHFHLGSQISSIRNIKDALREAGWLFAHLVSMGVPLGFLDVGGGLGVDYDGSQSRFASSMNYTLQEYANDVVYSILQICDQHGVPHPTIISESGRATVAHHAVLVVEVLGVGTLEPQTLPAALPETAPPPLAGLFEVLDEICAKNVREAYHDALQYRDESQSLFTLGHLSLSHRMLAEDVFWAICARARLLMTEMPRSPDELIAIERALSDTYFCNFSVFQSLPDSWAIDQLFPIVPVHRLDERPTRRAVLADITCDSDGKIDRFIDPRDVRRTLALHAPNGGRYHLAVFLVGAYQEILGDLHNLFGDTNAVHVSLDDDGYSIDHVVPGNTVTEVLAYVGYQRSELMTRIRRGAEAALRAGRMSRRQARELVACYQRGLDAYTYLENE